MMEPWKLTGEDIKGILDNHHGHPSVDLSTGEILWIDNVEPERAIAAAAQKKLLDYLASQVGPNPERRCICGSYDAEPWSDGTETYHCYECDAHWEGVLEGYAIGQQGYAKGLLEMERMEKYWGSRLHGEIHKERRPEDPLKDINVL